MLRRTMVSSVSTVENANMPMIQQRDGMQQQIVLCQEQLEAAQARVTNKQSQPVGRLLPNGDGQIREQAPVHPVVQFLQNILGSGITPAGAFFERAGFYFAVNRSRLR